MAHSSTTLDRETVHESFRDWQAEQAEFDAQLVESIAALDAYQSHLDAWQRELAAEREELRRSRTTIERDQSIAQTQHIQLHQIQHELNEAHHKIAGLTGTILSRTEELRELDRDRANVRAELLLARSHEKELTTTLETLQKAHEEDRQRCQLELASLRQRLDQQSAAPSPRVKADEPIKNDLPKTESTKPINPVLGSVMEQFDKLRQQRSTNRPPFPKTR